jgi:DNA-binding transcriptional LysR family regulator
MDEIAAIGTLLALQRERSFSAAALARGYTQPAVSKQIAAIERRYGTALVDRGTRPIRLTQAGEALARHGEAAIGRLRAAETEIDELIRGERGYLRVGTFSSAAATFMPEAVADFARRHPRVRVTLLEAGPQALVDLIRSGEIDVAVVYDYPGHAELESGELETFDLIEDPDDVLLPPGHALVRRRRLTIADLAGERWIFPTLAEDHPVVRVVTAACTRAGFEPDIAFAINDCQGAQALVAAGLGIALLPRLAIHPLHRGVVTRPLTGSVPARRILAARLRAAHVTPPAAAFVALLRETAPRFA